jgi:uncharacterized protein (DUF488 family)
MLIFSAPMQRPLKLPSRRASERLKNKALWNKARSRKQADFYTLGYEGRSTDDLIAALTRAGVRTLIDVRYTPLSIYRPELSKANFEKRIKAAGMTYLHSPQCGVPKDIRAKAIASGSRDTIWEWYDSNVLNRYFEFNLHWFLNLEHPTAMMCVEHDPEECHRHRIFLALEKNGLRGYEL